MSRFIKIDTKGKKLKESAKKWDAVLDSTTGLMWAVKEISKGLSWKEACALPATLSTAGFKDWRMPTVNELFALVDSAKYSPAIDTAFFPGCKKGWYWTSTPAAASPSGSAWYVHFSNGYAYWLNQDFHAFVRAVRVA